MPLVIVSNIEVTTSSGSTVSGNYEVPDNDLLPLGQVAKFLSKLVSTRFVSVIRNHQTSMRGGTTLLDLYPLPIWDVTDDLMSHVTVMGMYTSRALAYVSGDDEALCQAVYLVTYCLVGARFDDAQVEKLVYGRNSVTHPQVARLLNKVFSAPGIEKFGSMRRLKDTLERLNFKVTPLQQFGEDFNAQGAWGF